jgi:glutamyl-tRNA reductase
MIAGAALLLLIIGVAVTRRTSTPQIDVKPLENGDSTRYLEHMDAVEREFVDNPQQAAARARGLVEEVMRRMNFPDRLDHSQRFKDLSRHDAAASKALQTADAELRKHPDDTESLRRVVQSYRDALRRLLTVEKRAAA